MGIGIGASYPWNVRIEQQPLVLRQTAFKPLNGTSRTGLLEKEVNMDPPVSRQGSSFIADAVERVIDSVVNISVETTTESTLFQTKTVVSAGSGFFISQDGKILTNAHVIADVEEKSRIWVTTADGTKLAATVYSADVLSDLAILKIQTLTNRQWPAVEFGSNKALRAGDWVIAIGSPFGLQNTVTAGIVSSNSRRSTEIGTRDRRVGYIQTDCVVHSGSSGGPLVNLDGHVVGINSTRAEGEGISFAIRIDNALEMIRMLMQQKRVIRPWLGVHLITLSPHIIQQLQKQQLIDRSDKASHNAAASWLLQSDNTSQHQATKGILVTRVDPHSPASRAGLQEGDVIIGINDTPCLTSHDLMKMIGLGAGETFKMRVRRFYSIDFDWDGRTVRYDQDELILHITPDELDVFLNQHGFEMDGII